MKKGRTSAAVIGLVSGIALGTWIGIELTEGSTPAASAPAAVVTTTPAPDTPVPVPVARPRRASRIARTAPVTTAVPSPSSEAPSVPKLVMTIPVSAPEFHERIKPLLARGTKLPLALEGFTDAEQFATIAHAARNTQVPFILLKHRVLNEGLSLEEAIRASKPDVDAHTEALRAKGEARADILAVHPQSTSEN